MLSVLKNYGVTLAIGLVVFGLLAYALCGVASANFSDGFVSSANSENDDNDSDKQQGTSSKINLDEIYGQSFTCLLVGVDYFPDDFDDYGISFSDCYNNKSSALPHYDKNSVPDSLCTYHQSRTISADTIVLLHVDREEQTFVLYSIPKNTRVLVDGNYTKLGDLIYEKSLDFFIAKIGALTGLDINYHMVFTPRGFVNAMTSLGTVTFDVPCNMNYSDPDQNLVINVGAGKQELGGGGVLAVLRYASYPDGDTGRMQTTRDLMVSLLSQMKDISSMENATKLYSNIYENFIYSDLDAAAFDSFKDLVYCFDDFACVSDVYPGAEINYDNEVYYEPDEEHATEFLRKYRH